MQQDVFWPVPLEIGTIKFAFDYFSTNVQDPASTVFSKIPHLPLNLILQVHRGQNKSYDPNFNNPDFGLHRIGPYQRLFRRRSCERKEMGELAGSFSRASA